MKVEENTLPANEKPAYFQVGFGQRSISPELPCYLAGYFHPRTALTIHDDIFTRVFYASNKGNEFVLINCEVAALSIDVVTAVRKKINQEHGLKPEQILICATHTHTAPETRAENGEWVSKKYNNFLIEQVAEAVKEALAGQFKATLHHGVSKAEGFAFNRLYRTTDGDEIFGRESENIIDYAGPADPTVQVIAARNMDKKICGMLVNFACHPDMAGGGKADFVSADWPGQLANSISGIYGSKCCCLFLQGAAGDINHNDCLPHYLPGHGMPKCAQIGRGVAGAAVLAAESALPMTENKIGFTLKYLDIPFYSRDKAFRQMIKNVENKKEKTYFDQALLAETKQWEKEQKDGKIARIPIHAFRIGDIALAGFSGEIFTAWGLDLRKFSPAPETMLVELCNEYVPGYVPTIEQANRGGYGTIPILSRFLCADAGRLMVECAIKELYEIWDNK